MGGGNNGIGVMLLPVANVVDSFLLCSQVVELSCVKVWVQFAFACRMSNLLAAFANQLELLLKLVSKLIVVFVLLDWMVPIKFAARCFLIQFSTAEEHFSWILRLVRPARPIEVLWFEVVFVAVLACLGLAVLAVNSRFLHLGEFLV